MTRAGRHQATRSDDTLSADERRALREGCERALLGHGLRTPPRRWPSSRHSPTRTSRPMTTARAARRRRPRGRGPRSARQAGGGVHAQRHDGPADRVTHPRRPPRRPRRRVPPDVSSRAARGQGISATPRLVGRTVGNGRELLTLADLEAVHEPLAALLIELPQREIGGRLPAWDDLVALGRSRARGRGGGPPRRRAAVGVRPVLRPSADPTSPRCSTPSTSRSTRASVGWPGSMLLGEEDVIAEARLWRKRHGGTLYRPVAVCRFGAGRPAPASAEDGCVCRACPGDRRGARRRGRRPGGPRPAPDPDDASPPADHRGGGHGRDPTSGDRAAAVDLGRLVTDRDARAIVGSSSPLAMRRSRSPRPRWSLPCVPSCRPDLAHRPCALG